MERFRTWTLHVFTILKREQATKNWTERRASASTDHQRGEQQHNQHYPTNSTFNKHPTDKIFGTAQDIYQEQAYFEINVDQQYYNNQTTHHALIPKCWVSTINVYRLASERWWLYPVKSVVNVKARDDSGGGQN